MYEDSSKLTDESFDEIKTLESITDESLESTDGSFTKGDSIDEIKILTKNLVPEESLFLINNSSSTNGSTILNNKIIKLMRLTSQEQMILNYMVQFYSKYANKLLNILNGDISIRLIDYFVTNYSKKFRSTIINTNKTDINKKNNSDDKQIISIHSSYKSQLKAWNKKYFDPFSRGDRIPFYLNNVWIITTIGQLNFFKWFILISLDTFIIKNYNDIEQHMLSNKPTLPKSYKLQPNKKYKSTKSTKNLHNRLVQIQPISCNSLVKNDSSIKNNFYKKHSKIEVTFD
jgi:hypothetical protein